MRDTPFFPAFRSRLAALGRRSFQSLRQTTLVQFQEQIRNLIPAHLLSQEEEGPNSRNRCFNLRFTFECFVWQMLKPRTACREVVRQVQGLLRLQGQAPIDEDDSAYVQARQRLPKQKMKAALRAIAQTAARRAPQGAALRSRPVKVVDGSTTQLADTKKNQKRYPQPSGQKAGYGFPVMKFVALFCLNTGAILEVMLGSLHHHELRLFRKLWDTLKSGDIILGDRGFKEYATLAALPLKGVDVVARLHAMRKVDFRKAKRLGKNDGLFQWTKTVNQSLLFTARQWTRLPAEITVRIIRFTADIPGLPRPAHYTGHQPSGCQPLPGRRDCAPLQTPLAARTVSARFKNHFGNGTIALPISGDGREGTACLFDCAQFNSLRDGRSSLYLPSRFGAAQL